MAKTFTDFELRRGDNDQRKHWGGKDSTETGTPVRDLQAALQAVGVLEGNPDGDFGGGTHDAVKRFQWNVKNLKFRLVAGALEPRTPSTGIQVTGKADAATAKELSAWESAGAQTAGNLVRADVKNFPQLQDDTNAIPNPSVGADDLVIDAGFVKGLTALNKAAADAHVKLFINQAFRIQGAPVGGAVVKPATKSQHLIGHAIDCNIGDGGTRINSSDFASGNVTANAKKFVQNAKSAGLRWGGDFTQRDFVHFDDNVPPDSDEYLMRFYFNQRAINERQPIPPA